MTTGDAGSEQVLDGNRPPHARRGRLSGLMRMWITLSVAWLMGGSILFWILLDNQRTDDLTAAYRICSDKTLARPLRKPFADLPGTLKPLGDLVDSAEKLLDGISEASLKSFPPPLSAAVSAAGPADCIKLFDMSIWPWFRQQWLAGLVFLLAPIGLCWLVVYGPIRWIARGFQNPAREMH